jgi:hypothetical protein
MQHKIYTKFALFFCVLLLSAFSAFASTFNFEVNGSSSIAGLPVLLSTNSGKADSQIVFEVVTPDSLVVNIQSKTDASGFAKVKLSEEYTTKAGNYRVRAYLNDFDLSSNVSTFEILASDLDFEKSFSTPEDGVFESFKTAKVSIFLRDEFDNPIIQRLIKVVPDQTDLVYEDKAFFSDSEGKVDFLLSSNKTKKYNLNFFDVSLGAFLPLKTEISFINGDEVSSSFMGNSSGPVSILKFENLPDEIGKLEYLSLTVSAYDSMDQLVNSYKGKIRFSVVGDNSDKVILPADYAFVTADQGSHTFTLALLFKEAGTYKLQVSDISDTNIKGEFDFVVKDSGLSLLSDDSTIILESPLAGTYNSNIATISGTAQPGAKLKIFDNEILLTSLIADFEGKFSYTTNPLVNGSHLVYVSHFDNNDLEVDRSLEVSFTVDTEAPVVLEESFEPSGSISGGSDFVYRIRVDKPLSKAQVFFNDNIYDMESQGDNTYSIILTAPNDSGTYSIGIELLDSLNNELNIQNKAEILVESPSTTMKTVSNLIASGFDRRIVLTWDNPENLNDVSFYRIYYGTAPETLNNAVDTFTSSNTWYIPNLQNGLPYFFQIEAIGVNGDKSPSLSNIASASPVLNLIDVESPDVLHGVAGSDIIAELDSDVSNTGPGLNALIGSFLILLSLIHFRKKLFDFAFSRD